MFWDNPSNGDKAKKKAFLESTLGAIMLPTKTMPWNQLKSLGDYVTGNYEKIPRPDGSVDMVSKRNPATDVFPWEVPEFQEMAMRGYLKPGTVQGAIQTQAEAPVELHNGLKGSWRTAVGRTAPGNIDIEDRRFFKVFGKTPHFVIDDISDVNEPTTRNNKLAGQSFGQGDFASALGQSDFIQTIPQPDLKRQYSIPLTKEQIQFLENRPDVTNFVQDRFKYGGNTYGWKTVDTQGENAKFPLAEMEAAFADLPKEYRTGVKGYTLIDALNTRNNNADWAKTSKIEVPYRIGDEYLGASNAVERRQGLGKRIMDSLNSFLEQDKGTPVAETTSSPALVSTPLTAPYNVQSGDNLTTIAQKHGMTLDELLKLNKGIKNPNMINVGQELQLLNRTLG